MHFAYLHIGGAYWQFFKHFTFVSSGNLELVQTQVNLADKRLLRTLWVATGPDE